MWGRRAGTGAGSLSLKREKRQETGADTNGRFSSSPIRVMTARSSALAHKGSLMSSRALGHRTEGGRAGENEGRREGGREEGERGRGDGRSR